MTAHPASIVHHALTQGSAADVARVLAATDLNAPLPDPTDRRTVRCPLEWVLERPDTPERLAVVETLLDAGVDIHQLSSPRGGVEKPLWQMALTASGSPASHARTFRLFWRRHPDLGAADYGSGSTHPPYDHPWALAATHATDELLDELLAQARPGGQVRASAVRHLAQNPLAWGTERLQRLISFVPSPSAFALDVLDAVLTTPSYAGSPLPVMRWALSVVPSVLVENLDVLLEKAAIRNRVDVVGELLLARPSLTDAPWSRAEPLVVAAAEGLLSDPKAPAAPDDDVLERVLKWGGHPTETGPQGRTALHAILGEARLVLALKKAGHRRHLERLVTRLVRSGASWNVPDATGRTPLSLVRPLP